jgi:methylenetetrahydrofolate--tRNA-(uracil-5-)-methyltransferase
MDRELCVIGGGLAGSEAAWQAAERGIRVNLFEMRPLKTTPAHQTEYLSELICSNSLGSTLPDRPSGLLKEELRRLGSLLMRCAEDAAIPAGGALAVDRDRFARLVTARISEHPNITVIRAEIKAIPDGPTIIASGPLTSVSLTASIEQLTGAQHLYFYDAIAPIVTLESIDLQRAFWASRYDRGDEGEGDYLNCPMTEEEYKNFVHELVTAERVELRGFESDIDQGVAAGPAKYFEACLPVEVLARRDEQALAFGPLRPVGLRDPHTGRRPHAVVQLRRENAEGTLLNLVGFQTNLTYSEQRRILRLIPGLENAEFARYGQMHRNTFICSPRFLEPSFRFRGRYGLFFAGQITGMEGYVGNIASGLLAGVNVARVLRGQEPLELPPETMLGALARYISTSDPDSFQPMKANFGLLPALENAPKDRGARRKGFSERSLRVLDAFVASLSESLLT